MIKPGISLAVLGPSGTGKSHLMLTALQYYGAGIIVTAPGVDELESYEPLYDQATSPIWHPDGTFDLDTSKPYVIASFDDPDFAPSLGPNHLDASAQKRLVGFLRVIRRVVSEDVEEGKPPRWPVLVQDTFSGIAELAYNAMLSAMRAVEPPKARGEHGATFYGGLATRLGDVARASRAIRGYGVHWLTTSHVQVREASETARASELSSKEQHQPLMVGAFRERFTPMFDIVLHSAVDRQGSFYCLWSPDVKRQAKSRYGKLTDTKRIDNDWPTILAAIEKAERPNSG